MKEGEERNLSATVIRFKIVSIFVEQDLEFGMCDTLGLNDTPVGLFRVWRPHEGTIPK